MKNVLVSGYIGFGNFGDEAIFCALSKHLKSLGFNVRAFSSDPKKTKKDFDVETYNFKNLKEIFKAILKTDILISGGGSLLQNKTSNFSLLYYLFIVFLAKIFSKKVMVFSQGIEPINGKFFEFLLKIALKLCDFISVRDFKSLSYLKSLKINAHLTSDPVYSLIENIKKEENKEGLIIQLREFKGLEEELIKNLSEILPKIYDGKISILPLQGSYDLETCEKLKNELLKVNKETEILKEKDIIATISAINCAKYMLSMRFHGALISQALKTRTFCLCYDEKIKNLASELNIQNVDLFNYSKDELEEKLKIFFKGDFEKEKSPRAFDWSEFDDCILKFKNY